MHIYNLKWLPLIWSKRGCSHHPVRAADDRKLSALRRRGRRIVPGRVNVGVHPRGTFYHGTGEFALFFVFLLTKCRGNEGGFRRSCRWLRSTGARSCSKSLCRVARGSCPFNIVRGYCRFRADPLQWLNELRTRQIQCRGVSSCGYRRWDAYGGRLSLVEPELAELACGCLSSKIVSGRRLTPKLALSRLRAGGRACHCPGLGLLPGRVDPLAAL